MTTLTEYEGEPAQMMIALHAWHSRDAIERYHTLYPQRPLAVALTGTDINHYLHVEPEPVLQSLRSADALICFHDRVHELIPAGVRKKLHVIYQSAQPLPAAPSPSKRYFEICVIGHLREVKDPLRPAMAVRDLPGSSRIRVIQFGRALDPGMKKAAETEMKTNPRYIWRGDAARWQVRREFQRASLMVISSWSEGGANVISEAVVAGLPVVASAIDGNIGLLGADYAGYYPAGDATALRELLLRLETTPSLLDKLSRQCRARRHLFTPENEQENWRRLIQELTN